MRITKELVVLVFGTMVACNASSEKDNQGFDDDGVCDFDVDLSIDPFETPNIDRGFKLKEAADCEDAQTQLKHSIGVQMKQTLLSRRNVFLDRKQIPEDQCDWGNSDSDTDCDSDADTDWDNGDDDSADDYSETNNQVGGVDEADFVKNDGSYIYILADGHFQIVDAWPAADAHRIVTFEIEGDPKKMFVHEGRALIYSSLDTIPTTDPVFQQAQYQDQYGYECTYGWDCDFVGDGRQMKQTVIDISHPETPRLVRETLFSGSYVNSRRIGNSVFTVAAFPSPRYASGVWNNLRFVPTELVAYQSSCGCEIPYSSEEINDKYNELYEENLEAIEQYSFNDDFPKIGDTIYEDGEPLETENLLAECKDFYLSSSGDGFGFLSVTAVDITVNDTLNSTTVMGRPGAVYSDADSLYVANRHYESQMDWWFEGIDVGEATVLHKFDIDSETATAQYAASGVTKGRVLNQFAMDEWQDNLRVATTTGYAWEDYTHSTVSVLAEEGLSLNVIGVVDDIAPTEDIRSVRFKDDVGFVVTFKKTDPLFVIGLEDPQNPEILGELKIPGFSTYMHLMDDTHLLSIGYDVEDMDSFAWFEGIQLQIIDYSDLTNPALVHKEVIGTRGTASEAATDHLAFNYFGSRDLLALPMVICEESDGGGSYGEYMSFSGLLVYDVTAETGFERLGGVSHDDAGNPWGEEGWDGDGTCYQWWSQAGTPVKRSIFMENYVYSIAPEEIRIADTQNLSELMKIVSLETASE